MFADLRVPKYVERTLALATEFGVTLAGSP